jgi:hypothetical protein
MIAVKLDEDLPHDLIEPLRARSFDAVTVTMQSMTGTPDDQLLAAIQNEARWLFTADKGFSDIRQYVPGSHHGIVFFRADRESRTAYHHMMMSLLDTVDLSSLTEALIVVTMRGIRIVRPTPPVSP